MDRLVLTPDTIHFHREVSGKTCPGKAIAKEWILDELSLYRLKPRIPKTPLRQVVEAISAAVPQRGTSSDRSAPIPSAKPPVPEWGKEAVRFAAEHKLFDIRNEEDIRDAVKFYRFYQQFIQNRHD